ncbi:MAG: malate synthase [Myxococcota bacterium]
MSMTDFIPPPLLAALVSASEPVAEVPGLRVATGLRDAFPTIETVDALTVVAEVARRTGPALAAVLAQRAADRRFIDATTLACRAENTGRSITDDTYATVVGRRDAAGRIVVGPLPEPPTLEPVHIPAFLAGEQVTLFGPPDSERMAINAMNSLHRVRPDEPPLVAELVAASGQVPRWGADDEDSQTPIMDRFLRSSANLMGCYDRTLTVTTAKKTYALAESDLALPIKRIPGLPLPDGSHLLDGAPLPLHLFDFVSHVWHNRARPEALVFYVPKLENEAEAAYVRELIETTDAVVRVQDPSADPATVRILVVFESPRSIFRIREVAAALGPHFLGGSLGWHDFLASTARLFRHDPNYRIPVKADPDIVVNHIKESHCILADALADSGAMRLGGMYGVLFEDGNPASFQVSMVGFIRDVVAQMKRRLTGFWVAHPDFVRIGIALVEAWRRHERGDGETLKALVAALVPDPVEQEPLLAFVFGPDVAGLSPTDPRYTRSVLAADLEVSPVIQNHDPDEVRYNVYQALQYLADWLGGNGCVALPATLTNARGDKVFVRIMDDLATTERSRWELWAEVAHGRVPLHQFESILAEEVAFIRAGEPDAHRRVQVRWEGEAARWYPIAVRLLRQLVTQAEPVEFVPELLLPFTFPVVRDSADPWAAAVQLCPGKYAQA